MPNKFTFLFVLSLLMNRISYAGDDVTLLIPKTTSNQLVSLDFADENTGWAVGEYGTIVKTIDGGINWRIIEVPWPHDLADVNFPTSLVGYAVGLDGHIIKTTDGGESWTKLEITYLNNLNRVRFRDTDTGWTIGEKGMILHTTDGGTTWQKQPSGTVEDLRGMFIINEESVCVVGMNSTVLYSDNNGQSFSAIGFSNSSYDFQDVYFADELYGWIGGFYKGQNFLYEYGVLQKTSNGGLNWKIINDNTGIQYSCTLFDNAINIEGDIGMTSSPDWAYPIQQVYFDKNRTTGLCLIAPRLAHYQNLISSTPFKIFDEGRNLSCKLHGFFDSFDNSARFAHLSDQKVICTGFQGDFRFSNDGGLTWELLDHEHRWWENLIVGKNGKLLNYQFNIVDSALIREFYISEDFAQTWKKVSPEFYNRSGSLLNDMDELSHPGWMRSISQINDILWTFETDFEKEKQNKSVFYSTDFGITWNEAWNGVVIDSVWLSRIWNANQMANPYIVKFLSPDTVAIFGVYMVKNGSDYRSEFNFAISTDGGRTFHHKKFPNLWNDLTPPTRNTGDNVKYVLNSHFFNSKRGILVGSEGNIIKTENSGQSWLSINSGVEENLWGIDFIDDHTGFVGGDFGRILKTDDGGLTWRKTNSRTQDNIYSVKFFDSQLGWAGTENGLLYTTDGGENWQGKPLRYQQGLIRNISFDEMGNGYAYTLMGSFPSPDIYRELGLRYHMQVEQIKMLLNQNYPQNYTYLLRFNAANPSDVQNHEPISLPEDFRLSQNYPNPFNMSTQIQYDLPNLGKVKLIIYNIRGQKVRTLVDQHQTKGAYNVLWNGLEDDRTMVTTGIYFYRLQVGDRVKMRKMVVVR
ncbi:T9SS type A sorting domain-containing protein [candidate division KSB1 bacterium]|nr:T9SS type A sorting domain-containing protein [candidate division KSB1 bacterium]